MVAMQVPGIDGQLSDANPISSCIIENNSISYLLIDTYKISEAE